MSDFVARTTDGQISFAMAAPSWRAPDLFRDPRRRVGADEELALDRTD
jgi:hypothetical protein